MAGLVPHPLDRLGESRKRDPLLHLPGRDQRAAPLLADQKPVLTQFAHRSPQGDTADSVAGAKLGLGSKEHAFAQRARLDLVQNPAADLFEQRR